MHDNRLLWQQIVLRLKWACYRGFDTIASYSLLEWMNIDNLLSKCVVSSCTGTLRLVAWNS